jgi:hypothetical protein
MPQIPIAFTVSPSVNNFGTNQWHSILCRRYFDIFHCWNRARYRMEQWKAVSVPILIIYHPGHLVYWPSNESSIRVKSTIDIGYNTIGQHMANPAQYDTTRYEPRAIGLQCKTYMYGKPCTVHTIRREYSTVRYNSIRYEPRVIQYIWQTPHSTIWHDTIQHNMNRDMPTTQYIHVRQTPHSTYDPRFVLYFPRGVMIRTAIMPVANRAIILTIREIFFYAPRFFTIRSRSNPIIPSIRLGFSK